MLAGIEDPPAPVAAPPPTAIPPGATPIPPTIGAQPVLPPPAPAAPTGTVLPPDQESAFQAWRSRLPSRLNETDDYDLRGFFQKNPTFDISKPGQHLTDEFKLPNHETFSDESKYYNPQTAALGGTWQPRAGGGFTFVPNDPTKKKQIEEDANGNRVATPPVAPAALATADDQALRAATTDQEKAKADLGKADQAGLDAQAAEKQRQADEYKKRLDDYEGHLEASRADIKAAQDKAANTPFHEFQLSTGRQIIASLGMILGGASYDPNHVNQAVNIYQDAIKQDFAKQQAEHAKLLDGVKAAQDAGKALSEDQYRGLAELEKSQALKLEAVIAQSEKLASVSKNTLAIADLHAKNAELRSASSEKLENAARLEAAARETQRHNQAEEGIARGRLAIEREHAKAAAAKDRTEAEIKPISTELDKDEQRLSAAGKSPGLITKQQAIRELGDNLRQATASGDPQAVTAATIAGLESISKLNTGAVPNHQVLLLQNSLKGDPATAKERISKLLGNPKTSDQMVRGLLTEIDQADEGMLKQIDKEHARINQKYNAPTIGIAKTEAQRNHAAGRLNALFSQVTTRGPNGETQRYTAPGEAAPAAAQTTTLKLPDGSLATFDAAGKRIK